MHGYVRIFYKAKKAVHFRLGCGVTIYIYTLLASPAAKDSFNGLLALAPACWTLIAAVSPPTGQKTDDFRRNSLHQALPGLRI